MLEGNEIEELEEELEDELEELPATTVIVVLCVLLLISGSAGDEAETDAEIGRAVPTARGGFVGITKYISKYRTS